jgi:hypothetical protein
LEIRSIPGVFVHLIPTLIGDDYYSILAIARDFDNLAKKRAKYTVSAHPFLSDRKASHVWPPVKDLLRALVSVLSAMNMEMFQTLFANL